MVLLSYLFFNACYAKDMVNPTLNANQLNIKNFGFSYCLTKTNDSLNTEASLAMGGYFQQGVYEEPAYANIKKYINQYMSKENNVYQSTGNPTTLMTCLDMYNSNEYMKFIDQQRRFLID